MSAEWRHLLDENAELRCRVDELTTENTELIGENADLQCRVSKLEIGNAKQAARVEVLLARLAHGGGRQ